jgi:phage protein D
MTRAIIHLGDPDTGDVLERWETGDGKLIEGSVDRAGGKTASTLSVIVADPELLLASTLPLPTRNARVPMECWLGRTNAPPKVFAGYLSQLTPSGAPGRLELLAVDKSKGLRRVARSRNLTGSGTGDLIRRIAAPHGWEVDLSRADFADRQLASVLQHGETDAEVIGRIAEATGHSAIFDGDTVRLVPLAYAGVTEEFRLIYGENVVSYQFSVDELTRSTTPNVFDFDGAEAARDDEVEAIDRPVEMDRTLGLSADHNGSPSYTSQQRTKAIQALARSKKLFQASIESTDVFPGARVDTAVFTLEGFGERFSGVWFVDSMSHDLVRCRTTLELYNSGSGGSPVVAPTGLDDDESEDVDSDSSFGGGQSGGGGAGSSF